MFDEYRDLIERLKAEGTHTRFLALYDKHAELDQKIHGMRTSDSGAVHAELDALKREKLRVKDAIHGILRGEAAKG